MLIFAYNIKNDYKSMPGEGNVNPLQYSYLESSMDRGACRWQSVGLQRVQHDWATTIHSQEYGKGIPSCSWYLIQSRVSSGWLRAIFDSKFAQEELSTNTTSLSTPYHHNLLGTTLEKCRVRRNNCSPSQRGNHNTWRDDVP